MTVQGMIVHAPLWRLESVVDFFLGGWVVGKAFCGLCVVMLWVKSLEDSHWDNEARDYENIFVHFSKHKIVRQKRFYNIVTKVL